MRYDADSRRLVVVFLSGRAYVYHDVPAAQYMRLRAAQSKGAWFNRHIRDAYECERIDDAP